MFDEIYNFPGWENGEYRSLIENFKEDEYRFINFNTDTTKTFNAKEASIIVINFLIAEFSQNNF